MITFYVLICISGPESYRGTSEGVYQDIDKVFNKKSRRAPHSSSHSSSSSKCGSNSNIDRSIMKKSSRSSEVITTAAEVHSETRNLMAPCDDSSNNNMPIKETTIHVTRTVPVPKPRQPKSVHDYVNVSSKNGKLVPLADTQKNKKPVVKPPLKPKPSVRLHSPQAVRAAPLHDSIYKGRSNSVPLYGSVPVVEQVSLMRARDSEHNTNGDNHSSDANNRQSHYAVSKIDYTNAKAVVRARNDGALSGTPIMSDSAVSVYCDTTGTKQPLQRPSSHYAVTDIVAGNSFKPLPLHEANKKRGSRPVTEDYDNVILSPSPGVKARVTSYENVSFPSGDSQPKSPLRYAQLSLSGRDSQGSAKLSHSLSFSNPASADDDVVLRGSGVSSRNSSSTHTGSTDYEDGW